MGELGGDGRVDVGLVERERLERVDAGWTLRANSSNTRCWYSISVTKRAAWKRRSPFQPSAPERGLPVGEGVRDAVVSVISTFWM